MRCARCHRPLLSEPVIVDFKGYGPTCALKVQDQLPLQPVRATPRRRQRVKRDLRQASLLEVA